MPACANDHWTSPEQSKAFGPAGYVREVEEDGQESRSGSLSIGSLKRD